MANSFDQPVDVSVLRRARKGDRQAHATLYAAFGTPVLTLACRLVVRREVAEEILQDTFVEVIRSIDAYRGDGRIGPWIRRIAVSKCLMHFRSSWHRLRDEVDPAVLETHAALSVPDGNSSFAELDGLLARLPALARSVVWLHDVEGYTHREIGELMGKSTSFSKSQLTRAYTALRDALVPGPGTGTAREPEQEVPTCTRRSLNY